MMSTEMTKDDCLLQESGRGGADENGNGRGVAASLQNGNVASLPSRKSPRASWHGYDGGLYFVTSVTKNRACSLGHINNFQITLSPAGKILEEEINGVNAHLNWCEVWSAVVMPNHFHALIFVDPEKLPHHHLRTIAMADMCDDAPVGTRQRHVRYSRQSLAANMQGWLSVAVGQIKSRTTKRVRQNGYDFAWQPRFHDHIVRNNRDYEMIVNYIDNNVMRWEDDCFHADAASPQNDGRGVADKNGRGGADENGNGRGVAASLQ